MQPQLASPSTAATCDIILPMSSDDSRCQILHKGRFIQLVRNGHWEFAQRIGNSGVVGIIAVTPDERLILVQQHRIPVGASVIELPAGLAGDVVGHETEPLEHAARRELSEETGYSGGQWSALWDGPSSSGLTDEMLQLFLARNVQKTAPGGGDASESITVHAIALTELPEFLKTRRTAGILVDLKVYLAMYLLQQNTL